MNNELWDKKRQKLEKQAVESALNLCEHMGCDGFTLPAPVSGLFLSLGRRENPADVRELAKAAREMLADYDDARSEWFDDALAKSDLLSVRVREALAALEQEQSNG